MDFKTLLKTPLLLLLALVFLVGCAEEENQQEPAAEQEDGSELIELESAVAEFAFDDMEMIADEAMYGDLTAFKNSQSVLARCASVSWDTTQRPPLFTIDFGPTNCLCADGRLRRGKIEVRYTGRYRQPGSVITIKPVNYFVNDYGLSGQRVVTNRGANGQGNPVFDIQVNGQIINPNQTDTLQWRSNRQRERTAGLNTRTPRDDEWLITGTTNAQHSKGFAWTSKILNPLHIKRSCPNIVAGALEINPANRRRRTIDYGNGRCDNIATVTVGNWSRQITLR